MEISGKLQNLTIPKLPNPVQKCEIYNAYGIRTACYMCFILPSPQTLDLVITEYAAVWGAEAGKGGVVTSCNEVGDIKYNVSYIFWHSQTRLQKIPN